MSETEKKVEVSDKKGAIDKLLSKAVSRKLLVWATATAALFMGNVPADQWVNICMIYIGGQAVLDAAVIFKSKE